jgi:hypothetical protein
MGGRSRRTLGISQRRTTGKRNARFTVNSALAYFLLVRLFGELTVLLFQLVRICGLFELIIKSN